MLLFHNQQDTICFVKIQTIFLKNQEAWIET